uniref:Rab3 GTPase-activating protein catalytic subunit n=1 Tax=Ornithodoros turicata TaxID=34597 RepID=A0A2R5LMV7_9ACAR
MAVDDVINEDPDLYDITDFTTSTDWERFVASIEAVIHEWKLTSLKPVSPLNESELANGTWEMSSEDISFARFGFTITRHYLASAVKHDDNMSIEGSSDDLPPFALEDMVTFGNDFPPRAHYLVRWYGIRDFLVITPNPDDQIVGTEDRAKLLLSSVCLALSNSKCTLPAFVQIHHLQERLCFGVCIGGGVTTYFDMVHIVHIPPMCGTLSGLLSLFKTKLSYSSQVALPPVDITIRFTYIINEWSPYAWPQLPPDVTEELDDAESFNLQKIPFGALEDPISEMQLSVTWPSLPEDVIIDSDVHSDLRPTNAPKWLVRMRWNENPQCLMEEYLQNFLQLCDKKSSLNPAFKNVFTEDEVSAQANYRDVLDRMAPQTSLPVSLGVSLRPTSENMQETQLSILGNDVFMKIMGYIFLSLDDNQFKDKALFDDGLDEGTSMESTSTNTKLQELKESLCTMKTTHPGSLVWRLALAVSYVYYKWGDLQAVEQLWMKVISEIRHSWDNNYMLPSFEPGAPNLATCLLHQKLQMLNCCIERKMKRERRQQVVESSTQMRSGSSESDEDEFYECPDEFSVEAKKDSNATKRDPSSAESSERVGEGILRQCGNMTLLGTSKPLFIPVTQDPVPMTEDMLEEHAEALVQLGSNPEGAALRARMQSACLLSDMEAFKAANPGASLGDFVRWYSPRDWIAAVIDEVSGEVLQEGHLSPRMQLPGNTWQEVWDTARPVPAHRQKRLFDDTKEAEKVLHYLLSMGPASIASQLMPVLVHCALAQIVQKASKGPPSLVRTLDQTITKTSAQLRGKTPKYKEVLRLLYDAEVAIVQGESLRQKFDQIQHTEASSAGTSDKQQPSAAKRRQSSGSSPESEFESFVMDLLDKPEVDVPGAGKGPVGKVLSKLFTDSQKVADTTSEVEHISEYKFPVPVGREYILRARHARPTPASRPMPQRMYCVMAGNDFRLAGAFTNDLVFY